MTTEHAFAILDPVESDRLGPLFIVLLYCGLRKGEAIGLRWIDVDLDAKLLRVRQSLDRVARQLGFSDCKTDKSKRDISLHPDVVTALDSWRKAQHRERMKLGEDWEDNGLVFTNELGMPIGPETVNKTLKRLLKAAKLPHMRVHDLRHACATLLLSKGVPMKTISTILGHSSIQVTADVYTHVEQQLIADAMNKLPGRADRAIVANS